MKTTRKPGRSLAVMALSAAAVLAAAAVFRYAGRGVLNARLTEPQGDPAALQGFTLQGRVEHSGNARTTFAVQDGGFTSATELDTDADPQSYGFGSVRWGTLWTVLPQDLDAVNAAAESSGDTLYSQASRLVRICTLNLPDGSCVAFPGMTCELDEPVQVAAYWDELRGGWQAWRDAADPGALPDGPQLSFEAPRWQGNYCFVWPQSTDRMTAGVYRVDQALSDAEADAQDVSPAPAAGGSYGAVSCLYAPQNAARMLACLPLGERMGALYLDRESTLRLDIVDADGALTESCPLVEQVEASSLNDPELLPRQRAGEAAFRLLCAAGPDGEIWEHLVVVRVENGRVSRLYNETYVPARTALGNATYGGRLRLAQLDGTGDRLLLVEEAYDVWRWTVRGYEERAMTKNCYLTVQDTAEGKMLYSAKIKTDQLSGWGWGSMHGHVYNALDALHTLSASSYIDFPDLAE